MKSRWFSCALAALLFFHPTLLRAEEAVAEPPVVVPQKSIGPMACGPCSLLNALKFGGRAERTAVGEITGADDLAKVRHLIEEYGRGASEAYPDRPRYREKGGMCDLEMLGMVNDCLANVSLKKVEGAPLDHTELKSPGEHLRDIHARLRHSLDTGFPPLVIIRSFVAKAVESPQKGADAYQWWGMTGHWMAVIDLPKRLTPGALSFTMKVADSWTGVPQDCFVYEEQFRNFTAAKGDDRKWIWPTVERPYLVAVMPALPLGTKDTPWYLRSNIVLSYGIYRK